MQCVSAYPELGRLSARTVFSVSSVFAVPAVCSVIARRSRDIRKRNKILPLAALIPPFYVCLSSFYLYLFAVRTVFTVDTVLSVGSSEIVKRYEHLPVGIPRISPEHRFSVTAHLGQVILSLCRRFPTDRKQGADCEKQDTADRKKSGYRFLSVVFHLVPSDFYDIIFIRLIGLLFIAVFIDKHDDSLL